MPIFSRILVGPNSFWLIIFVYKYLWTFCKIFVGLFLSWRMYFPFAVKWRVDTGSMVYYSKRSMIPRSCEGSIIVEQTSASWSGRKCDLIRAGAVTSIRCYTAAIASDSICISLLPSGNELVPSVYSWNERKTSNPIF